ncbi:MAG: hypothetical protein KAS96_05265, partial [Planctomycetes bacterium]|nr:hypothetical protein [Planctomycetota bacterium]
MKKYLVILALAVISLCLICSGCQSENVAEEKVTPAKPSAEKAKTAVEAPSRSSRSRRGGFYGDWQVEVNYNERTMESILSFSRD